MRFFILIGVMVLLTLNFCEKDDKTITIKKGHFLSKIFYNDKPSEIYHYNNDGFLIQIDRIFIMRNDTDIYKMLFEYNSNGLISKWIYTDTIGNPIFYELFKYNNYNQLISRVNYNFNKLKNNFEPASQVRFEYKDKKIEERFYQNGIKTSSYVEFEYDLWKQNILSSRYYSSDSLYLIELYEYDKNFNPIHDLKLPLPLNIYNIFERAVYFSKNNLIKVNSLRVNANNASIDSFFSDMKKINYKYDELNYPITWNNGFVELNIEYMDFN